MFTYYVKNARNYKTGRSKGAWGRTDLKRPSPVLESE